MPNPLSAFRKLLLQSAWYVHTTASLTVEATPAACVQALARAAKPSVERLHLRDVFSDGRRYYLETSANGFRLKCRSMTLLLFFPRKRIVTVLSGNFESIGNQATRLHLRTRMALSYLLEALLYPLVIGSIILPFDLWQMWFRVVVVALILGLVWRGHRAQATLQAVDMIYFVERALEGFAPVTVHALDANTPHVVDDTLHRQFRQEWEKFYREHERD
jgi:hypothetical protein